VTKPVDAFVSLGSNLGDRATEMLRALDALAATHGIEVVAVSNFYETDPVGPPPQGPYLNAAARIRTTLPPRAVLERLLAIENEAGRVRTRERNTARSLDLDLLLFGEQRLDEPGLSIPHPRMHERAFVLEPLCEIAGERTHPALGLTIAALAARVRDPKAVRRYPGR
jgi:2-amino-4-hydroxy-6-hydroxymethyldihydropteridine diphosphokinase